MFGTNYFPEAPEDFDSSMFQGQIPGFFMPSFEGYPTESLQKDMFSGFPDVDQSNFFQLMDQAFQSMPEELKQWFPFPMDCLLPQQEISPDFEHPSKPASFARPSFKVGTITLEERRVKVQKFLEKRKRRNFKKKISYMCRKKVADKRVRIKGRFVSKVQAEAIREEQIEIKSE
jgi:hypothetical protein